MLFSSKDVKDLKLMVGQQVPRMTYYKEDKSVYVNFGSYYSNDDKIEILVYEEIATIKEAKNLMEIIHDELVNIGFKFVAKDIRN